MTPPPRLRDDEIAAALQRLEGFRLVGGRLRRRLRFPDFAHAFAFMTAVAQRAEAMQHHPDWRNVWARVDVSLWTHDAGGVTALDLDLARSIDELAIEHGGRDAAIADETAGGPAPRVPWDLPPLWLLLAIGLQTVLHYLAPVARWLDRPWTLVGILPIVLAVALMLWALLRFRRFGTGLRPFSAVRALVEDGPFKFTRNPMYLGMFAILVGVAVLCGTVAPALVLPPFVLLIRERFVRREERFLERCLGDPYRDYCRRVPRWW